MQPVRGPVQAKLQAVSPGSLARQWRRKRTGASPARDEGGRGATSSSRAAPAAATDVVRELDAAERAVDEVAVDESVSFPQGVQHPGLSAALGSVGCGGFDRSNAT